MEYTLYIQENASQEDVDILCEGLNENTKEKTVGLDPIKRFHIFARDTEGKIIGGAKGVTYFGCLYTDILWVDKQCRNQDLGTTLIHQAEKLGRERGCSFATLTTMSFEALPFYQKMGYVVEHVREGYQGGHKCFLLRKSL